jgi:NhaA family Na+:H+ antiporter
MLKDKIDTVTHKVIDHIVHDADVMMRSARHFFHLEASGGILLVLASVLAMVVANTELYYLYNYFFNELHFSIGFTDASQGIWFNIDKHILHWINDGLMAVFFFLIGLEIKRELLEGELSSREKILLPLLAAMGGMAVPALIFYAINIDYPQNLSGWAIPAATDIAFALGILALMGSKAPISLKILLTAIAIIDDLGAIIIIALFYTADLHANALLVAGLCFVGLIILNSAKVMKIAPYAILGGIMWVAVLNSGVHATLAGVVAALCIPLRNPKDKEDSPCKKLEHELHPWVAFLILPIFGFANAGISFAGMTWSDVLNPVVLGIALGLFFGKQLGVFVPLWLAIKSGLSPKPTSANWVHLYAVSVLCGIGFTMSLFIGGLAYDTQENATYVRLGVIIASVASAVVGCLLLYFAPVHKRTAIEREIDREEHALRRIGKKQKSFFKRKREPK